MKLSYLIIVTSHHLTHASAVTAVEFAKATIDRGHNVSQVFFYASGALTASQCCDVNEDEVDVTELWKQLAEQYKISLNVCVTSATRRGILDESYAKETGKSVVTMHSAFNMSNLSNCIESLSQCDRVMVF
ncbi:MAG: sulfurtransferase complex subunit TusD [Gammaproteobacteria bacterium]